MSLKFNGYSWIWNSKFLQLSARCWILKLCFIPRVVSSTRSIENGRDEIGMTGSASCRSRGVPKTTTVYRREPAISQFGERPWKIEELFLRAVRVTLIARTNGSTMHLHPSPVNTSQPYVYRRDRLPHRYRRSVSSRWRFPPFFFYTGWNIALIPSSNIREFNGFAEGER